MLEQSCRLVIPNPRRLWVRDLPLLTFVLQGRAQPLPCDIFLSRPMSTPDSRLTQTLASLGISSAEGLRSLFAEIRSRFDAEAARATDDASFKAFRDAWLGRKSGVITLVTDNWLKPASSELKRSVGAALNELRGHVDAQIEAKRIAVESGTESA